jgi:site-specific DNA recombinase
LQNVPTGHRHRLATPEKIGRKIVSKKQDNARSAQQTSEGPDKAVVYVRVSTEEQTKGYSLQTQEERCREYAAQKGYVVVERFLDSQSGEDLNRPDLNRLFAYIVEHPVQVLIVYDTDRLSRGGPYQHGMIERLLNKNDVRIEYVRGDFNEASPESQFSKMIQQTISWYENQQRKERSMRGRIAKTKAGRVLASAVAPIGYEFKNDTLVIIEHEAELVRRAFRLYLEGYSLKQIAQQFTAEGIPTKKDAPSKSKAGPTSRTMWYPGTVARILHNQTYIGVWHYNKTNNAKVNGQRQRSKRASADWLSVPVPALVDEDTFNQAQAMMERNKILSKRNTKREYLLRGILKCSCGNGCLANARGGRPTYRCPGTIDRPHRTQCDLRFQRYADLVDDAVWRGILEVLLDESNLRQAIAAQRAGAQNTLQPLADKLEALQGTRQDLERKLQALIDLFLDGSLPRHIAEGRKNLLKANLDALDEEERRVRGEMAAAALTTQAEESLLDVARTIRQGAAELSFEEKRRIVMLLQVKVQVLSKTQLKIGCLLPMTLDAVTIDGSPRPDKSDGGDAGGSNSGGQHGPNTPASDAGGQGGGAQNVAGMAYGPLGLPTAKGAAAMRPMPMVTGPQPQAQDSSFVNTTC